MVPVVVVPLSPPVPVCSPVPELPPCPPLVVPPVVVPAVVPVGLPVEVLVPGAPPLPKLDPLLEQPYPASKSAPKAAILEGFRAVYRFNGSSPRCRRNALFIDASK